MADAPVSLQAPLKPAQILALLTQITKQVSQDVVNKAPMVDQSLGVQFLCTGTIGGMRQALGLSRGAADNQTLSIFCH